MKKGIGKFQRHLPLILNQSPSKLGSLPVEVIGFSSQGQNAYRPLVSEACLGRFRVIFFNSEVYQQLIKICQLLILSPL